MRDLGLFALAAAALVIAAWHGETRIPAAPRLGAASIILQGAVVSRVGAGWLLDESPAHDEAEMPACDREGEQAHEAPDSPSPAHATSVRDQEGSDLRLPQTESVAILPARDGNVVPTAMAASPCGRRSSMPIVEAAPESVGNRVAHPVRGPPARRIAGHRGARG